MQDQSPSLPEWAQFDRDHIWHPYSAIGADLPVFPVASTQGVRLTLSDGRELIDGMSSWWSAIHGYNVPELNDAAQFQLNNMSHVMFGGLTHEPAARLAKKLVELTPDGLNHVFFSDSGSVSVEVSMKMAMQYWAAKGRTGKTRFATLRGGYHGDTFSAMSVCDPVTGMHSLFSDTLTQQFFVDRPACRFDEACTDDHLTSLQSTLEKNADQIAALILEPIVQGAGGMYFYSPAFLSKARALCDKYDVLLIADEIATGFGRSGKLFACEHAGISPDIMCVGKALTGGYLTMAATLCTSEIAQTISQNEPGVFMHGPTFMANPLACSVANASIELLMSSPWKQRIENLQAGLEAGLSPCREFKHVSDVRVLGAIGVVEMKQPVDMTTLPHQFVDAGVWVRPFGRLIYLMPPYIMREDDLCSLTHAVTTVVANI